MAEAERIQDKTAVALEEAATKAKVSVRTVRNHRAQRRAGKGARASRQAAAPPSQAPTPSSPPAGSQEVGPGVAVFGRPDVLELVRRILDARNGAARAELDEGLRVFARGGEVELAPWLARPIEAVEVSGDELVELREALGAAVGIAKKAEAGGPQLRALAIVERLAKTTAVVQARRPRDEGPDEVTRRLVAVRDQAIARIGLLTSDRAAKLAADREQFAFWCMTLGPIGGEVQRRVDAMLGGAPP